MLLLPAAAANRCIGCSLPYIGGGRGEGGRKKKLAKMNVWMPSTGNNEGEEMWMYPFSGRKERRKDAIRRLRCETIKGRGGTKKKKQ